MNKCHNPMGWRNDTTPAINETNLNYMDGCIDTIDDRVVAMDTSKANQSDLLTALSGVTYNTSTGVFTFTWKNGTTATVDLNIEKIPVSFSMDENGVITMITEDGTTYTADVSAILKTYSFTNSSTIGWTVTRNGNNFTVVADVIDGSITANKLQPNYLADVTAQAQAASAAATAATNKATLAQSYAVGGTGTRAGEDTDNAKWYMEQAAAIVNQSFSGLSDVNFANLQDGQVPVYDSTSRTWKNGAAGLLPHVVITSDAGATVTLTKGGTTITATETSTGHFEADVDEYGTWTIDSLLNGMDEQTSLVVDTVKIYTVDARHFQASITVYYNENGTCSLSASGQATKYATSSPFTFVVHSADTYTLNVSYDGITKTKNIIIDTIGQSETCYLLFGITFSTGTDNEIALMVAGADAGEIDLYDDCGWRVGQERTVSLSAILSSGTFDNVSWSVGEAQNSQSGTLVLMHRGLYELVTPVLDVQGQARSICSFVVGLKNCMETKGYYNSAATNSGSWDGSARRNWCNGGFRQAIPEALRSAFKEFKTTTIETYNGNTNKISNDYFALPAEKEVHGSSSRCNSTEATALTQFTWYETTANQAKTIGDSGAADIWWARSPAINNNRSICYFYNGSVYDTDANGTLGFSPFGCM